MGAWSYEPFGNDDACDWASQLGRSHDLTLIEITLDVVLAVGSEYLEAPEASEAIAAADAIARLRGRFGQRDSYSELVDAWAREVKVQPSEALMTKATRVLDRIISEPSELLELWQESDEGEMWLAAVRALKARIGDEKGLE